MMYMIFKLEDDNEWEPRYLYVGTEVGVIQECDDLFMKDGMEYTWNKIGPLPDKPQALLRIMEIMRDLSR